MVPCGNFLKRKHVIKEDFSHRHLGNSDVVSDEESQGFDKFHCISATTDKNKRTNTMKDT
jgi:hypothetical protein